MFILFVIVLIIYGILLFRISLKYRNLPLYLVICLFPILPSYFAFRVGPLPLLFGWRIVLYFFLVFEIFLLVTGNERDNSTSLNFAGKKLIVFGLSLFVAVSILRLINIPNSSDINAFILGDVFEKVLLLIFVVRRIKTPEVFARCLDLILYTACIVGLFGTVEFVTGLNIFSLLNNYHDPYIVGADAYIRLGQVRIESAFGHSITYSLYLGIVLIIGLYQTNKKKSLLNLFVCLVLLVNFGLAMSRFPMLVLIGLFLFYIIFAEKKLKGKLILFTVGAGVTLVVVTLLVKNSLTLTLRKILYMLLVLFDKKYSGYLGDFGVNSDPFGYRLRLFNVIFNAIKSRPVFGFGYHYLKTFSFRMYSDACGIFVDSYSIDNNYLLELLCTGIAGIGSYLVLHLSFLYTAFRNYKQKWDNSSFNYYCIYIILFYLINLISVAAMEEKRIYWIFLALLCAYNNISTKDQPGSSEVL
jgi:O-antigen ligase